MKKQILIILITILLGSCGSDFVPKPRGYFRIELPDTKYKIFDNNAPYKFEYSSLANISKDKDFDSEPYWININYPAFRCKIHISYKPVSTNINSFIEDSRTLAYKHSIKADAIGERVYTDFDKKIYGILYVIKGNAASPAQFYLTDSSKHFVRGSLYFSVYPNKDSLSPVIEYVMNDIKKLMETIEWQN